MTTARAIQELASYEDMNDAEMLRRNPAMHWVVGDRAIAGFAASASQMGRFETKWLNRPENLIALAHPPVVRVQPVRRCRAMRAEAGHVHRTNGWRLVLEPAVARYWAS